MSDLYNVLAHLCEQKGVSAYRMCKDVGIQPSIMTDLKKGRRSSMKAETIAKIAAYFEVSVESILGFEQKEIPADKGSEDEDDDFVVLARHMKKIPEKERQRIIKNFRETVDMYLEVVGITDDKDKEGK